MTSSFRRVITAGMARLAGVRLKYLVPSILTLLFLVHYFGILVHLWESDYYTEFTYPLDGDVTALAAQLRRGEKPSQAPINPHDYTLLKTAKGKCVDAKDSTHLKLRIVFIVKSAVANFERRRTIRSTWGAENRFSDVPTRTVFALGAPGDGRGDVGLRARLEIEANEFGDIVQGSFRDTYFNNTYKAMMGLRWATEICPKARFYFFVDDDYYVSVRNVLRFLRNPVDFPGYLEQDVISFDDSGAIQRPGGGGGSGRQLKQLIDFDLPDDAKLYAGFVFHSPPHRHKSSKWYVSLSEYPYHLWPPYVTAGAYVLSREAARDFYYTSYFVARFRFDDVFVGLVARKAGVEPLHSDAFHFQRKPWTPATFAKDYRYVVASHGFDRPRELAAAWQHMKEVGNA